MTNPISPPPKKMKITNSPPLFHLPSSSSYSSLLNEIIVNCVAWISKSYYSSLCLVSKSFYSLLSSPEIYISQYQIGATEPRLYVCLRLPTTINHRWFTLMNPIEGELILLPLTLSYSDDSPPPSNSTTVPVGSEIYQIGGTVSNKRSKAVRVLDCQSHTWRCAPNLTVARKCAKSCLLDGKIYVMGGCVKSKESMNWGEVFDLKTQTWKPLPRPSDGGLDPNDHKVVVLGGKLYVITKNNKYYAYDPKEVRWKETVDLGCGLSLEDLSGRGPWCVIQDVIFSYYYSGPRWYDSSSGKWLEVQGLAYLDMRRPYDLCIIQLVNYGGKLVILWYEYGVTDHRQIIKRKIMCALIRLEKRLSDIWGKIERYNVVVPTQPKSYKLECCPSVTV